MRHHSLGRVLTILVAVILVALVLPLGDPHSAAGGPSELNAAAAQASAPHPHVAPAPRHLSLSIAGYAHTTFAFAAAAWVLLAAAGSVLPRGQCREPVPPPGRRGRALLHAYLN